MASRSFYRRAVPTALGLMALSALYGLDAAEPSAAIGMMPPPISELYAQQVAAMPEEEKPVLSSPPSAGANPGPDIAHLASYKSAEGAAKGWRKLTDSYSSVLYFTPLVREVDLPGKGRYFRLYADGDAELTTSLCQSLKQRKLYCKLHKRDPLK